MMSVCRSLDFVMAKSLSAQQMDPETSDRALRSSGRLPLGALLALALVLAISLSHLAVAQQDAVLDVVATTGMVGDIVREVAGPCAQVTVLMGPGIDPHLYRASAGDVDRLARAELIVFNGFDLEGQLGAVLARLGQRVPTLALAERIADELDGDALLEGEDQYAGRTDPHLWGAVELWALGVGVVEEVLSELQPGCADGFAERANTYASELGALHEWALESAASVPAAWRTIVSPHDAFAYFGIAYGFAVAGIEGISTESEASIADIRETADLVMETGVPAIFVETTISPRTIEAVLAAVRDRGAEVVIGGELFGDAMGEAGTPEGTYVGMVRHNVETVITSLGGRSAPWPEALDEWARRWSER